MYAVLFLLILAAEPTRAVVTSACGAGQCFTTLGCAVSAPGVACAECSLAGYIALGACVCGPSFVPLNDVCAPLAVSEPYFFSPCYSPVDDDTKCLVTLRGVQACRTSVYGVLCDDCGRQGYVRRVDDAPTFGCACYDPSVYDATVRCAQIFDTTSFENVRSVQSFAGVVPHASKILGFFKSTTPPKPFGAPNPPIPDACLRPPFGPPPNTFITSSSLGFLSECNTFVALDPDSSDGVEKTCAGHGDWSRSNYRCECFPKWRLVDTGYLGPDGEVAYVCSACSGWWGPNNNASTSAFGLGLCTVPWTPDPVTGEDAECSGHGTFVHGECLCDQSVELGFWAIGELNGTFSEIVWSGPNAVVTTFNATVRTCVACSYGFFPLPGSASGVPCTTNVYTRSPTARPSGSPVPGERVRLVSTTSSNGAFGYTFVTTTTCTTDCASVGRGAVVAAFGGVEIADMPAAFGFDEDAPVVSLVTNQLVAPDWIAFTSGELVATLNSTGVVATEWWTEGCDAWYNASALGIVGSPLYTNLSATHFEVRDCAGSYAIVCACFT
jgi:hypothetical protein